jgi:hypothetical protein
LINDNHVLTLIKNYRNIFFIFCLIFSIKSTAQQTEKIYLSGTGNDHTVNWEFFCTEGRNSGKWTTIAVPSCWELQGFGKYDYGFAKDSVRGKEQGLYRYRFSVPAAWKSKQVNIDFEGSMTDTEVKINGKAAGEIHQGAFYAFKYDITNLLNYGAENLLEVTVAKHSANPSVNNAERKADFWVFGGIFRPVFLEVLPLQHIQKLAIDAKADGSFRARVFSNVSSGRIQVQLFNSNGAPFGKSFFTDIKNNNDYTLLNSNFSRASLWSAEFPNLYKAVCSLVINGKTVHTVTQKFGFRTVEVKQRDGIYVNGVKVKMKGVNRHSFWPSSGRTTSRQLSIDDVLMMKDMNMNAVRMSHYPPDDHFLEACDSLGLYVMDELAGWHGNYNTRTGSILVEEMLDHDVNHPSIIFWSNGNEGGHNTELDPLFAQYDPQQRPVLHPWENFGGFDTQHYRDYNYGIGNYNHGHDIVMPTEFLHGLYDGGHGAGLQDYWEAMWHDPLSAGGFLWDFADEGVVRTDKDSIIDTDGNHGADGIVGPYHQKEGSYFAIKEIWSPIKLEHKELTPDFDAKLVVENRYHFTNLDQCSFSLELKKFNYSDGSVVQTATGGINPDHIAPGQKGFLHLRLTRLWLRFDVLLIKAWGPDKKEIFTWSLPISHPATVAKTMHLSNRTVKPLIEERDSVFHVMVNKIDLLFNSENGLLVSVKNRDGEIPFNNGPILQEGQNNFKNFSYHFEDSNLVIESAYDKKNHFNTLKWTVYPSGIVGMDVKYFPGDYFTLFDGVNFSFPEKEIKSVQYMGDGPYRVWKNRMRGDQFGIWTKEYNNTETGEAPWIYPEFKGYHSRMYWCKVFTKNQQFTVMTSDEDVFLRLFTPAFKDDAWHNYMLNFPSGDISFMQGIPAIGTKTQRAETTGPMGAKNIFYDYEKDPKRAKSLRLFFKFW